jgi:hypothetical protein
MRIGSGKDSWGMISARTSRRDGGGLATRTEGKVKEVSIVGPRSEGGGEEADKPAG